MRCPATGRLTRAQPWAGRRGRAGGVVGCHEPRPGGRPDRRTTPAAVLVSSWPADDLPDGLVIADHAGRVTVFNRAASRLTGIPVRPAIGPDVRQVLAAAGLRRAQLVARPPTPTTACPSAPGTPRCPCTSPTGPSCWSPVATCGHRAAPQPRRRHRDAHRRRGPAPGVRAARCAAAGPPRAQPRRPGVHRGARAAVPADQREGLHRHAAGQVGPVHRRPEEGDAGDRQRRRGPGHQAHHRTARRVPDRVGADGGPPAAGRRPGTGGEDRRRAGGSR